MGDGVAIPIRIGGLEQIVFVGLAAKSTEAATATATATVAYATWKIHYHEVNFY